MTVLTLPWRDADGQVIAPHGHITSVDLVQRAGITYRQLDYWTRTGLLAPAARRPGATSGDPRFFPTEQLHRAATIAWLLRAGVALPTIRLVIDQLLEAGHVQLAPGLVIHLPDPA